MLFLHNLQHNEQLAGKSFYIFTNINRKNRIFGKKTPRDRKNAKIRQLSILLLQRLL